MTDFGDDLARLMGNYLPNEALPVKAAMTDDETLAQQHNQVWERRLKAQDDHRLSQSYRVFDPQRGRYVDPPASEAPRIVPLATASMGLAEQAKQAMRDAHARSVKDRWNSHHLWEREQREAQYAQAVTDVVNLSHGVGLPIWSSVESAQARYRHMLEIANRSRFSGPSPDDCDESEPDERDRKIAAMEAQAKLYQFEIVELTKTVHRLFGEVAALKAGALMPPAPVVAVPQDAKAETPTKGAIPARALNVRPINIGVFVP